MYTKEQFTSMTSDITECVAEEITDFFSKYERGSEADLNYLLAKNSKLKTIRNWNPSSNNFIDGVSIYTTYTGYTPNTQYITFQTPSSHGLKPGDYVTTYGFEGAGYNTTTQVYSIESDTLFTIKSESPKTVYGITGRTVYHSNIIKLTNGFTTKGMVAGQTIYSNNGNIPSYVNISSIIDSTSFSIQIGAYSTGDIQMNIYGLKQEIGNNIIGNTGSIIGYTDYWVDGANGYEYIGPFSGVYDSNSNVSIKIINGYTGKEQTIQSVSSTYSVDIPIRIMGNVFAVYSSGYDCTITLDAGLSGGTFFPVNSTVYLTGLTGSASALNNKEYTVISSGQFAFTINTSPSTYGFYQTSAGSVYSRINGGNIASYFSSKLNSMGYDSYIQTQSTYKNNLNSTLTSGSNVVTLVSGNTSGIVSGQPITNAFPSYFATGALVKTILNSTSFTVTSNHVGSGAVNFSIDNGSSSTIIVKTSTKGACIYNSYIPNVSTVVSNSAYLSYTSPSNLSQLGFHSGKCPKLASTFMEYSAISSDQAESMLNELNSSCNG